MIELHTNPEAIEKLYLVSDTKDGDTLTGAAVDHRNLKEYAERLERNVSEMSAEIQGFINQREQLADVLFELIQHRIGQHIDRTLADREDATDDATDDKIRETVKDMIRDGDITVEVDYSNIELDLTINA